MIKKYKFRIPFKHSWTKEKNEQLKEKRISYLLTKFTETSLEKYTIEQLIQYASMGPKFCSRKGLLSGEGWRRGYTK